MRSPNGGQSWIGGPALYEDNSFVTIKHWPLPRVHGNRPLYVGFLDNISESSAWIGFVRGNDISGVRRLVVNVLNQPLLINLNRNRSGAQVDDIVPLLPGGSGVLGGTVGAGVDMAVDPTDANRLYVVAHDTETATAGDIDVNIYLWKLTRDDPIGLPNVWTVHPRVLVADDDDLGNETDQFMPAIVVDALGVVHVIFYSDRGLVQDDGAATQQPQFDVWYAFSVNQGSSFPNQQELFSIPPSRAVDFAQPATNFALRDYIGIPAGADRVLTSFMGRNALDTGNPNKSLIWSSQITRQ